MADANAKRVSVDDIRNAVVKSSDSRLREELIGSQTFYNSEDVSQLNRQELLRHVLQIRTLNNSHLKCQTIMTKFDPSLSQSFSGDDLEAPRSFSLSDNPLQAGGGVTSSKFGVSAPIVQSLDPAADQFSSLSAIERFMMMQASIEAARVAEADRKERLLKEERDAERRQKETDRDERRREKDEQRKFERELLERKETARLAEVAAERQLAADKETARLAEVAAERQLAADKETARLVEAAKKEAMFLAEREADRKEAAVQREFERKQAADIAAFNAQRQNEELQEKDRRREQALKTEYDEKSERDRILLEDRSIRQAERESDRIEREKDREERHQQHKADKAYQMERDSRFEIRLKRASDIAHSRLALQPSDLQGCIAFFKNVEFIFKSYEIDPDLQIAVVTPFLNTRCKKVV